MVHKSFVQNGALITPPSQINIKHTLTVTSLPAGSNLCVCLVRFL